MSIKIKRSSGDTAPATLDGGQLAYVEGSTNGGTLYYGEIGGTVRAIAGKKYIDKLGGIEAGAQVNTVTSVAGRTGAVTIAVADVSGAEATANKGAVNGYASLDSSGLVPSTQLPSYVDDVLEYANLAGFPGTGTSGKIYVAIDTGKTYRWSGSVYVEISASPGTTDAVTEGSTNLYFTQARARQSISVTDSGGDGALSYDNSTGVITYTGPSASDVRAHFSASTGITITNGAIATTITQYADSNARSAVSATDAGGDGSFSYSSSTGAFTYTGPGATDYRAAFSAGTAISITDGVVAFTGVQANGNELENVVEDTTPQLGGALDVNGQEIVSTSNGAITLAPNGSGSIVLNKDGTGLTVARRTASTGTASNALSVQRNYTADVLANMDGHMAALSFSLRDSSSTQAFFARVGGEYATDGNHSVVFEKSGNNFTSATRMMMVGPNTLILGDSVSSTAQNITTIGTQDLVLNTNFGTDSGSITITDAANGNISITPNGTGSIVLDGLNWPTSDGSANYVLKTNGSGQLSWTAQTAGVTAFTGLSDVPSSYSGTGGYYVKVNSGATALEFSQHVDDGTF